MVPHRGLVHPWLSEPVWVPENAWPLKTDTNNRLRSDEDYEESTDRHRDRVSFSHEVISVIYLYLFTSLKSPYPMFDINRMP